MAETVERFGKTTRWFHWTFASCFLALAGSGAALASREALGLDASQVGDLVSFHEAAALGLLGLPALVWLSGQTARTTADLREALRWSRDDWRWLRLQPAAILGRAKLPPAAKLNAGQKLNSVVIALLGAGLFVSGSVLWLRPGSLAAWFLHLSLFVLWIPLFLGHMALAFLVPATRPALRGMLFGRVDRAWAEHHHPLWARGEQAAHDSKSLARASGDGGD